jgi:hypothetical protein
MQLQMRAVTLDNNDGEIERIDFDGVHLIITPRDDSSQKIVTDLDQDAIDGLVWMLTGNRRRVQKTEASKRGAKEPVEA